MAKYGFAAGIVCFFELESDLDPNSEEHWEEVWRTAAVEVMGGNFDVEYITPLRREDENG